MKMTTNMFDKLAASKLEAAKATFTTSQRFYIETLRKFIVTDIGLSRSKVKAHLDRIFEDPNVSEITFVDLLETIISNYRATLKNKEYRHG